MHRFRVAVADFVNDDLAPERGVLNPIADVEALNAQNASEIAGRLGEFDALMAFHRLNWTSDVLNRLTRCKIFVRCGVGYDNVDVTYARSMGLPVANVPDYGTEEIADSAIGMTLALVRGVSLANSRLRRGLGPWHFSQAAPIVRLRGRVFGIVGCGRIGMATALRAKALGMEVVFYDPYQPDGLDKALGMRRVESLDELLRQSFVVSPHCLLTPETRHLIDAAAIAKMPRGSFLVNTSRGAVVELEAIPDAIASGQLSGAAIDVFPEEPPPDTHPLIVAWRNPDHPCHDRVIINPHSAFYCTEGLHEMRVKGAEACRRALLGLPVRTIVN